MRRYIIFTNKCITERQSVLFDALRPLLNSGSTLYVELPGTIKDLS